VGGPGGGGLGAGKGRGEGEAEPKPGEVRKGGKAAPQEVEAPATDVFRVEVLGNEAVEAIGGPKADVARRYRVGWPGDPHYYTLDEVKKRIRARRKEEPPLRRIEIVVYRDSPDKGPVSQLESWARELQAGAEQMRVDLIELGRNAPVR
jgi:hypothetical protein